MRDFGETKMLPLSQKIDLGLISKLPLDLIDEESNEFVLIYDDSKGQ